MLLKYIAFFSETLKNRRKNDILLYNKNMEDVEIL